MARTIIDSPRLAARLKEGGVASEQAEAIAKAFSEELGEELAGDARPESRALDDPERRGTLIGEVRLLKWVVGLAFLILGSVFYALYHFQYLTFEKASLDVANQAAARVQVEAVKETITTLDEGTRTRIDTLETNTRQHITALETNTRNTSRLWMRTSTITALDRAPRSASMPWRQAPSSVSTHWRRAPGSRSPGRRRAPTNGSQASPPRPTSGSRPWTNDSTRSKASSGSSS